MAHSRSTFAPRWNYLAGLLAWLMPGLGHLLIGQKQRGLILGASIGIIWLAGLLIGGISVIDHQAQPFWFVGQLLIGPSVAVDLGVQKLKAAQPDPQLLQQGHPPIFEPSFGRINEQGILYTALAGLLNLLAILDVICRTPGRGPGAPESREEKGERRERKSTLHSLGTPVPLVLLWAYRPFLDPLPLDTYWLILLLPLVLVIAMVYKAIKLDDLGKLPGETVYLAVQIITFMILAAAGLWLVSEIF